MTIAALAWMTGGERIDCVPEDWGIVVGGAEPVRVCAAKVWPRVDVVVIAERRRRDLTGR